MTQLQTNPTNPAGLIDRFLRGLTRLYSIFRGRRASATLLQHARAMGDPERDTETLGLWAFFRVVPSSRSRVLDLAAERFAGRTARDARLAESLERTTERMIELDGGRAERHFLAITGYAADELPASNKTGMQPALQPGRRRADRVSRSHRVRPGMLATLLVLFVVALASRSTDPLAPSLTALSEAQPVLFGSLGETVRGHGEALIDETSIALVEALGRIEAARTSLLGFHTGYERSTLLEASQALERALRTDIPSASVAAAVEDLKSRIDGLTASP